ncbi:hypothetical protein [Acetobacteroides hydrogenigenes]|uniref:Uncharacterized protein n=1 Tax=Acetobacteroides hydrogenigenes TaxID=979970 RepID=A0A4R2EEN6_9BACT|nr:hypothetical protein [Acetobacteroides hydrogenigenes]TCN65402.1 hypothetical protein CLV25_11182 [Acetobacteroides hydrogenigenes]
MANRFGTLTKHPYIYGMLQWRKIASLFLLLAYIFVLALSVVPHHHHIYGSICTENSLHHDNEGDLIIADCLEDHDDSSCCPKKTTKCDDMQCISRIVYLSGEIAKLTRNDGDQPLLPLLLTPFIAGNSFDILPDANSYQQSHRLKYYPPNERIVKLLLTSGVGLRAPPVLSLRG